MGNVKNTRLESLGISTHIDYLSDMSECFFKGGCRTWCMFLKYLNRGQLWENSKSYAIAQNNSHIPKYYHFRKILYVLEATLWNPQDPLTSWIQSSRTLNWDYFKVSIYLWYLWSVFLNQIHSKHHGLSEFIFWVKNQILNCVYGTQIIQG